MTVPFQSSFGPTIHEAVAGAVYNAIRSIFWRPSGNSRGFDLGILFSHEAAMVNRSPSSKLNLRPLSRAEVRDVDRRAIEEFGMPGIALMENAGRGVAELLVRLGIDGPVTVCAGRGNNGGDGFVIARHLENRGFPVCVLLFADPNSLEGDAATNFRILKAGGTHIIESPSVVKAFDLASSDWIVDALLGTGMRGTVREPFVTVIRQINDAGKRVLAVDLPSGLDCDTGEPLGACIRAAHTATFVSRKLGFDAPGASQFTGEVHVVEIGVPRALLRAFEAQTA
jgi:NAD(P)H-hydrate epimerase